MELDPLLNPSSLAVVGVSRSNPFHPATVIYDKNHLRYGARTYAINPHGGTLYGEEVYRRLADLPERPDLAVVCVRAELVPQVLRDCVEAGVRSAIVVSGGFAETGRDDLQTELATIARAGDIPVVGPNCLGVYSPPAIDTFFLPFERVVEPRPGSVALISQSGGILVDLMLKLTQEGVGLSRAVSIGNKVVLDEVDLLSWFLEDPRTSVIGLYLEGFGPGRGRDFVELANRADKPVLVMKSGKTPGGSRAVSSHTASLAGDYRVFRDVIASSRAIETQGEADFVAYCEALTCCRGNATRRLAIVTASGGHGAIASDGCFDAGLQLADLPAADQAKLREQLSPAIRDIASLGNPIDLTGSAGDPDFVTATRFVLARDDVDALLLLLMPYLPALTSDVGARIAHVARELAKPVFAYVPHVTKYGIFIQGFEANGVPVSHSVEGAVAMARAIKTSHARRTIS